MNWPRFSKTQSRGRALPVTPKRFLSWPWAAALCGIAILLVAIAALQYRWNAQIRQATEVRMGADLESAMMNWHLDLYGEFSAICVALQIGPDSGARDTRDDYLRRYDKWVRAASAHPAGKMDPWRKQAVCLFGLAQNGQPITNQNPDEVARPAAFRWKASSGGIPR